jgi:ATP-dependent DNA ligase
VFRWTRNGHDWSDRFPLITEAALRNRNRSFVLDGEAVLGVNGRSGFNGLHLRRQHDAEVEFYTFESAYRGLRRNCWRFLHLSGLIGREAD